LVTHIEGEDCPTAEGVEEEGAVAHFGKKEMQFSKIFIKFQCRV